MTMLEYGIEMLVPQLRIRISGSPLLEMISAEELHIRPKPRSSIIVSGECEGASAPNHRYSVRGLVVDCWFLLRLCCPALGETS